jgi:phosphoglycolate phosphatase-like HAD superfamily hydrolase
VLPQELERFESTFLEGLTRAHGEEPNAVNEIPGALKLIDSIASGAEHDFGIATGGMRSTALFKLRAAGFDITGRPAAFANDSVERAELVRRVLNASSATAAEAVYVGDAVWDAKAAAELGVRFVGVTHDSPEARLRNAGVTALVKNYLDRDAFFSAVDRATSPSS